MYEFDSLCIYVFIHVKFIYDCNIWLYYQLTTVTDTYFRFLEENVVGMGLNCPHQSGSLMFLTGGWIKCINFIY